MEQFAESLKLLNHEDRIIKRLTNDAREFSGSAPSIVYLIKEKILASIGTTTLLASWYLLDSMVKSIQEPYTQLFSPIVGDIFVRSYERAPEDVKIKLERILATWYEVFGEALVASIKQRISSLQQQNIPKDDFLSSLLTRARDTTVATATLHSILASLTNPEAPSSFSPDLTHIIGLLQQQQQQQQQQQMFQTPLIPSQLNPFLSTGPALPPVFAPSVDPSAFLQQQQQQQQLPLNPNFNNGINHNSDSLLNNLLFSILQTPSGATGPAVGPPVGALLPDPRVNSFASPIGSPPPPPFQWRDHRHPLPAAIEALYAMAEQCSFCGLRFHDYKSFSRHLSWHQKQNEKKAKLSSVWRPWFLSTEDWIRGVENEIDHSEKIKEKDAENQESCDDQDDFHCLVDESQPNCALCNEPFEKAFVDDAEQWMYQKALVDPESNSLCHISCLRLSKPNLVPLKRKQEANSFSEGSSRNKKPRTL